MKMAIPRNPYMIIDISPVETLLTTYDEVKPKSALASVKA